MEYFRLYYYLEGEWHSYALFCADGSLLETRRCFWEVQIPTAVVREFHALSERPEVLNANSHWMKGRA